jgi:hypothetical protein
MRDKSIRVLVGPALTLLLAGCYTQIRPPAGDYDGYGDGYWYDPYYESLAYYTAPWEMYPGHPWWYAPYGHVPHWAYPPPGNPDRATYDEVSGRHGWDRGPGAPHVPRTGIGGGVRGDVSTGSTSPSTSDENGGEDEEQVAPRDTDRESGAATSSGRRSSSSENAETKRNAWGR